MKIRGCIILLVMLFLCFSSSVSAQSAREDAEYNSDIFIDLSYYRETAGGGSVQTDIESGDSIVLSGTWIAFLRLSIGDYSIRYFDVCGYDFYLNDTLIYSEFERIEEGYAHYGDIEFDLQSYNNQKFNLTIFAYMYSEMDELYYNVKSFYVTFIYIPSVSAEVTSYLGLALLAIIILIFTSRKIYSYIHSRIGNKVPSAAVLAILGALIIIIVVPIFILWLGISAEGWANENPLVRGPLLACAGPVMAAILTYVLVVYRDSNKIRELDQSVYELEMRMRQLESDK